MKNKILVVSHERSGTHFLINTISMNWEGYSFLPTNFIGTQEDVRNQYRSRFGDNKKEIFKSHHQFYWFEDDWEDIIKEYNVLYIVRDPKDVMVSSWMYHNKADTDAFPRCETIGEWMKTDPTEYSFDKPYSVEQSDNMVHRWCKHMRSWKQPDGVIWVSYEFLCNDFQNHCKYIESKLGIESSREKFLKPTLSNFSVCPRKGIVGDHRNYFTESDHKYFKKQFNNM